MANSPQAGDTVPLVKVSGSTPAHELRDGGYPPAYVLFCFSLRSSVVSSRLFSLTVKSKEIQLLC